MVKYNELTVGKHYALGDVRVGEYIGHDDEDDNLLFFSGSEGAEKGERAEIDADDRDVFVQIATPKRRTRKGRTARKRVNKRKTPSRTRSRSRSKTPES